MTLALLLAVVAVDPPPDIFAAARKGDVAAVRKALEAGVPAASATEYGATPLHFAADKGHVEVVKLLIAHKADLNATDKFYGATPLVWASMNKRAEVVGVLVKAGATGGGGVLTQAARNGDLATAKAVLDNTTVKPETLTAARKAATAPELVALLEKAGAKPPEKVADAKPADAKPAALSAYAGVYHHPAAGDLVVKVAGDGLEVLAGGKKLHTLTRKDGDLFAAGETAVTFARKDGKTTGAMVAAGQAPPRPFEKVDRPALAAGAADPVPAVKEPGNWPQFRGTGANGVADGQFPPTTWDVPKGHNVRWKTPIPGLGHACPVVWGDKVFITTAVGDPKATLRPGQYGDVDSVPEAQVHSWHVLCLDKHTGKVLWDVTACQGVPKGKRHLKGTHANPTPATDGQRLVVSFGAEGLYCYNLDGKELWRKDLGPLDSGWFFNPEYQWGFASSPVVAGGKVFVQCDAGKESYIAAFDLATGKDVWRTPRAEPPSWGTPTVVNGPDRAELVATGTKFARGYDPDTGAELWKIGRLSEISVPTPFYARGLIFVVSGYRPVQPIFAIKPGATGDLTPPAKKDGKEEKGNDGLAWVAKSGGSYLPTPLVYGEHLYVLANSGQLTCYEAVTGKKLYSERVGGASGYTASPVAADGRIYCVGETNGVRVVKAGPEFELLAVNPVGETCMSTPAIADGMLFLRTEKHLVALGVPRRSK